MTEPQKKKFLTLKEKIQVIEDIEKKVSQRSIAKNFGCSKTQIYNIWDKREDFKKLWMNMRIKI